VVDWRYIQTMKIPLVAGRVIEETDTAGSEKVVVINEKAASRLCPGENAVGKMVRFGGERRVVGVVGNVRHQSVEQEGELEAYLPITQSNAGSVELVVRTRLDSEALASSVRSALRSVDPNLPTAEFQPLGQLVERALSPRRFLMLLLAAFAAAAVVLASVGIYGVVSYNVNRRTQEIGIRMALGASGAQVRREVLSRTMTLVSAGIALGVIGSLLVARLAASLLFRLTPQDPLTFGGTVALLLLVAAAAGFVPAWRASRVDPMSALHTG